MTPVCIKLHNFKKFKIEHEGQLYELAATSTENLLSEFQKYKPEVKQLLVARPMAVDDFESLAEGSVVFASTQSYITEAQMQSGDVHYHSHGQHDHAIEYKSPQTTHSSAIVAYNSPSCVNTQTQCADHNHKLRTDLSMVDNFCAPPSGFVEAVADPGPINTIEVARRVRDILERHKISQTLFSRYVIRRSQGTTSDLLRSPKQWDRMSEEGRTPYRRMKAWLEGDLVHNVQMLVHLKQGHDILPSTQFTPKGLRTKFTDEQRDALELFFSQNPRLTHDTLEEFASEQNLTISAVRNWVNNRKQRLKRSCGSSNDESDAKVLRTDDPSGLHEEAAHRGSHGEMDSSGENGLGHNDLDSPTGIPTMVGRPTLKQEDDEDMDNQKSEHGNGFSSNVFSSSTSIPTMVENIAMNCLAVPTE